jgi:hypothetical protein
MKKSLSKAPPNPSIHPSIWLCAPLICRLFCPFIISARRLGTTLEEGGGIEQLLLLLFSMGEGGRHKGTSLPPSLPSPFSNLSRGHPSTAAAAAPSPSPPPSVSQTSSGAINLGLPILSPAGWFLQSG